MSISTHDCKKCGQPVATYIIPQTVGGGVEDEVVVRNHVNKDEKHCQGSGKSLSRTIR